MDDEYKLAKTKKKREADFYKYRNKYKNCLSQGKKFILSGDMYTTDENSDVVRNFKSDLERIENKAIDEKRKMNDV